MRYSTFVNKVMYSQKTLKKVGLYLQCVGLLSVFIHWVGGPWGGEHHREEHGRAVWYSKCLPQTLHPAKSGGR